MPTTSAPCESEFNPLPILRLLRASLAPREGYDESYRLPNGCYIRLHVDKYSRAFGKTANRVVISASLPEELQGITCYYRGNNLAPQLSFTASLNKSPVAIAGDINRRLLPELARSLADHRKVLTERAESYQLHFNLLLPVANALDTTIETRDHDSYGHDLKVRHGEYATLNLKAKANPNSTLKMELDNVPPDLALLIARAIRALP